MNESFDVLIVGVGGQGTILASNVLGEACLIEDRHVMSAETHGMAQRGGSVESHVRIDGIYGPLISPGTADLIIAFDMLEALRYRHFLKEDGKMIVNSAVVIPTSAFQKDLPVPSHEEILERLGTPAPCVIDAAGIAVEAGSILAQNIVMLGAASHFLPLASDSLTSAVRSLVPPKTVEINVRAFDMGRDAARGCGT
ncbi:MAG: indolepyruvate oxidoreductase subunit beta [Methanomicrobiaceae archaeon]|nr:indolepyruvate oxidoreductase subunit beta [Methanomicrobiaceae archaeon]